MGKGIQKISPANRPATGRIARLMIVLTLCIGACVAAAHLWPAASDAVNNGFAGVGILIGIYAIAAKM